MTHPTNNSRRRYQLISPSTVLSSPPSTSSSSSSSLRPSTRDTRRGTRTRTAGPAPRSSRGRRRPVGTAKGGTIPRRGPGRATACAAGPPRSSPKPATRVGTWRSGDRTLWRSSDIRVRHRRWGMTHRSRKRLHPPDDVRRRDSRIRPRDRLCAYVPSRRRRYECARRPRSPGTSVRKRGAPPGRAVRCRS